MKTSEKSFRFLLIILDEMVEELGNVAVKVWVVDKVVSAYRNACHMHVAWVHELEFHHPIVDRHGVYRVVEFVVWHYADGLSVRNLVDSHP